MIYNLRVISNEVDDFILEIAIDSIDLFVDLHSFLQKELNFDSSQITSFFITDDEWNKETEVTLLDMMGDNEHNKVMDQVCLEDLITRKKQRLLYTFDVLADRVLFLELTDIKEGSIDSPICLRKEGTPPPAQVSVDSFLITENEIDDEFDSFDIDEEDFDWDSENPEEYHGEEPDDNNYY